MKRIKTLLLVTALLVVTYLTVGLAASADGPFMEVRFLRVLVNAVVNGDLSVLDDLSVTDAITGASVAATGAVSGASGTFTTATIGSATVSDDVVIADDLNVKDVVVTTSLTLGGVLTNIRYGMETSVTDGMTITHGLGGAPLFVMLEPYGDGITVPVNVTISDTTSFTVNVPDGVTVAKMSWFAGK